MMNEQMKHPDAEILRQYADALLDPAARAGVERHIEDCASCRDALRIERALSDAIRALPSSSPSHRFDRGVLDAVQHTAHAPAKRMPYFRYAAVGLLILTTFVVVIVAGASGEAQSQSVLTPVFERITAVLSPVVDLMTQKSEQLTPQLDDGDSSFFRIFFLATAALLIIGGLERLLSPSFRHSHKS